VSDRTWYREMPGGPCPDEELRDFAKLDSDATAVGWVLSRPTPDKRPVRKNIPVTYIILS
jgi:hypothetical protein